jgi:hypothetical protein
MLACSYLVVFRDLIMAAVEYDIAARAVTAGCTDYQG